MLSATNLRYDDSGFCWILESDRQNVRQASYQIQVADNEDFSSPIWDSGMTLSDESIHISYSGGVLKSASRYYWRVKLVAADGDESSWSSVAVIDTGLEPADWRGNFITPDTDEDAAESKGKYLRRTFSLDGDIARATVYATAHGLYELYLNGQRVGEDLFMPGWTEYKKRLLHQQWDVTGLLQSGQNAIGAGLGAGWFKGDLAGWIGLRNIYGKQTALLLQLEILYKDGRKQLVATDEGWKWSDSPILYSELYHGETYDARLEQTGWSSMDFDDGKWQPVCKLDADKSVILQQDGEPVRRQEVLSAKEIITTPKSETVIDFGQNMTGWVRFRVKGNSGDRVVLKHAEILDADGNFYTENMRGAKLEIRYILKGGVEEHFEPHFTFQGFRYVHIVEYPGTPALEDFEAIVIHSQMNQTGKFECSNPMLNQLHHNILWSLKGNFLDICTDCPQRDERLGWTGDAQVFARTATYLMDTQKFFRKWLRDLRASQFPNGGVPFVVPDVLTGKFTEKDVVSNAESVSGWGDAAVINPWIVYLAYGDKSILAESYDSMKAWVDYIKNLATNGLIWNSSYQLGDWVALDAREGSYFGATPTDLIATAYYAYTADIVAKTADILGNHKDAETYAQLRKNIGKAYSDEYFTKTGRLVAHTQTAYILSLAFGLTPCEYKARTTQGLLTHLEENDGHLTTGFLGTPYFLQVLADNGCLDAAYALLLKEDYPSWLYQITMGATTIWEHWDGIKPDGTMWSPNMNSFNHYAYGAVGEFLYRVVAGIDTDCMQTGYKHIIMRPRLGGGLTHAQAEVVTPYGLAKIAWNIEDCIFKLSAIVPHNATATVILPDDSSHTIGSGKYEFTCKMI